MPDTRAPAARPGGHIVADALVAQGVDTLFGVPGESYLVVLDGLYRHRDRVKFVICRQEGGASFMADAYAKLTGKPGVVLVTRGPGATNGSIGVHTAQQDSTPLVMLVGQVGNDFVEREAFQEIDYRRMFGSIAKWVAQIDRADRVPEYVAHAFQVATAGRPGPVVLALPEDMLAAEASVADAPAYAPVQPAPAPGQVAQLRDMLARAQRPFVIVGGGGWTDAARADLRAFVEGNELPVGCAFRWQDVYENDAPNYAGDVGIGINPKLSARIRESDLVIAIGVRLGEMTTSGYTLFTAPVPRQTLVHCHPGAEELGRVYRAALMINSGNAQLAAALRDVRVDASAWRDSTAQASAELAAWRERPPAMATLSPAVDLWAVMQTLRERLPRGTVLTNGAGNFATWAHRFWRYGPDRRQLAPTSGAMGYGIPAAVAAKIARPDLDVVCVAGDGDFLMTGQELATAVQYGAGIVVVVFNNGMYGTIRMHQERDFPARVFGTELANPDFAKLSQAYGGFGERVAATADFGPALDRAIAFARGSKRPALVELAVDPQAITPNLTLDQIRQGTRR